MACFWCKKNKRPRHPLPAPRSPAECALVQESKLSAWGVSGLPGPPATLEEPEAAFAESGCLPAELADASKERAGLQAQLQDAQSECTELRAELADASKERAGLQAQLQDAQSECIELRAELADASKERAGLQAQLQDAQSECIELRAELADASKERAGLQAQLQDARSKCAGLRAELADTSKERAGLQAQLQDAQSECIELRAELADASKERAGLQAQLQDAQSECIELRAELADASKERAGLQAQLRDAQQKRARWPEEQASRAAQGAEAAALQETVTPGASGSAAAQHPDPEDVATNCHGNGANGQELEPAEACRKEQVWEKLQQLGEDMATWSKRSTRDLATQLVKRILQTDTAVYPMAGVSEGGLQPPAPARPGVRWRHVNTLRVDNEGRVFVPVRIAGSEEVDALVDVNADVSAVQLCPQLGGDGVQDRTAGLGGAMCYDVPFSIGGTVYYGDVQHLPAMPELCVLGSDFLTAHRWQLDLANRKIWEVSEDNLLEQAGPPVLPRPSLQVCRTLMLLAPSQEPWREEFPDVWTRYKMDCGLVSGEENITGGPVPFQKQYAYLEEAENAVANILEDLLAQGVVVEGTSPSNSPLWPVKKANKKEWRLTVDYRAVNRATARIAPVVLDRTKIVTALSPKSKYFSVLDLSNCSFAIPLAPACRARFAFTFRGRQYLFTRLPQGLHNTTTIVHQRVAQMLAQLPDEDKEEVLSYVDDIIIAGKTQEETRARTRRVLELIQKTGFKAKLEKAQLVQPKVNYLGITIGPKGREIQESKLKAVDKKRHPRDVRELQGLLGWFRSMQEHVEGYSEIAQPLYRLMRKPERWEWGPEHEEALSRLKDAILRAPALRFPDRSQPFVIRLTTSEHATGAALLQEDEQSQLVPVAYHSQLLKDHEVSYSPREKECLVAVQAVQAFRALTGPAPVVIQMPHSPLKYLLWGMATGAHTSSAHPAQWALLLVNRGVPGETVPNGNPLPCGHPAGSVVPTAPPLRLLPSHVPAGNVWFTVGSVLHHDVDYFVFAAASLEERWLLGMRESGSAQTAELAAVEQVLRGHGSALPLYLYSDSKSLVKKLQEEGAEGLLETTGGETCANGASWPSIWRWIRSNPGVLHVRHVAGHGSEDPEEHEWNLRVGKRAREMPGRVKTGTARSPQDWEPSRHEKQEIVAQCHGWLHEGVEGSLARARRVARWEGDEEQVAEWVQNCLRCATAAGKALPLKPQRADGPWSQLQVSYVNGLPQAEEGHQALLVVLDVFSGWVEAFPLRERTAEAMAKVVFKEIVLRYGMPATITSDLEPHFFQGVMRALRVEQKWDILCPLQSPGQLEGIKVNLKRVAQSTGKDWVKKLPLILAGIRSVARLGTALTPYPIIFGFPMELRVNPFHGKGKLSQGDNVLSWLNQLPEDQMEYKHRIEEALLQACPQPGAWQPAAARLWQAEDQVMYLKVEKAEHGLEVKWEGPFSIIDIAGPTTYRIDKGPEGKWVHRCQLRSTSAQDLRRRPERRGAPQPGPDLE